MSSAITGQTASTLEAGPLDRLAAVVLLGGSVRPTPLSGAIGRHLLDLPVSASRSILGDWCVQASDLADKLGIGRLPLRVLMDRGAIEPSVPTSGPRVELAIQRDALEYRGTGGLLRDLSVTRDGGDYLLVLNAAQVLLKPLPELAQLLAATKADVALWAEREGMPGGLMLVRCGAMASLPQAGFIDMKEQALPMIAARHDVRVVYGQESAALPVRTLADYVRALRATHRAASTGAFGAFTENWRPSFSIVESGAVVDASAKVLDSVILRGGQVGASAIVARSVVCGGGSVSAGQRAVDAIVATPASPRITRVL